MADKSSQDPPLLEIQIHPGSVRWGVRCYFLTRRQLRIGLALVVGVALFVILNLSMTPHAVVGLFRAREYQSLITERERQGDRLQELTTELESLAENAEDLRLRMGRIFLTYGLSAKESIGQGGYPFSERLQIDSIYADAVDSARRFEGKLAEQLAVLDTFLSEVESFESAHGDQVRTTPSISPLVAEEFVLTSPFGSRRSPFTKQVDLHAGLDMAATEGTLIRAPADGLVVFSGRYPLRQSVAWWRYGNLVALRHGDLFITLFGHCQEIRVRNGQRVTQGEVVATVGNTGWSTSPHLHYEVRRQAEDGQFVPVDPRIYILDHRWRDEERLLIRARGAPELIGFEPLPSLIARR